MNNSFVELPLDVSPFALDRPAKRGFIEEYLSKLTKYHYEHCIEYKRMLDAISYDFTKQENKNLENIPFLPVSLFKELELSSVKKEDIFKITTSSGTTGQQVSKIFLDKETASSQQKILIDIVSTFLNSSRLPMLIIDSPSVIKDRKMFSARGAGILGFSLFGRGTQYALHDDMTLNYEIIETFLEKYGKDNFLIFGFTFMIWQHFYKELSASNKKYDFSNGILFHGGGWKKLVAESISMQEYNLALKNLCGLEKIHDYYGMVEQTGSIYVACEHGHLHTSIYSDIITRRAIDFSPCEFGEKGIIQVLSVLPKSYPGHSLLTEDEGIIHGEDDCPCGRSGKYFSVLGRIKNAEIRGCSDTYASNFS